MKDLETARERLAAELAIAEDMKCSAIVRTDDLRRLLEGTLLEEDVARAIAAAFGTSWEAGVVSYRADPEIADEGPTDRYFLAAMTVGDLCAALDALRPKAGEGEGEGEAVAWRYRGLGTARSGWHYEDGPPPPENSDPHIEVQPLYSSPAPKVGRDEIARAVCAHSPGGFCRDVGGDLGCKNGRGVAPHWSNCVASDDQLGLFGNTDVADAVLALLEGK